MLVGVTVAFRVPRPFHGLPPWKVCLVFFIPSFSASFCVSSPYAPVPIAGKSFGIARNENCLFYFSMFSPRDSLSRQHWDPSLLSFLQQRFRSSQLAFRSTYMLAAPRII
jgi:hypothetical protein